MNTILPKVLLYQLCLKPAVRLLLAAPCSVSLTEAGRRLVDGAGPSIAQVAAALAEVSAKPGETVGRLRLTVPRAAMPFVIDPVVPTFRQIGRAHV